MGHQRRRRDELLRHAIRGRAGTVVAVLALLGDRPAPWGSRWRPAPRKRDRVGTVLRSAAGHRGAAEAARGPVARGVGPAINRTTSSRARVREWAASCATAPFGPRALHRASEADRRNRSRGPPESADRPVHAQAHAPVLSGVLRDRPAGRQAVSGSQPAILIEDHPWETPARGDLLRGNARESTALRLARGHGRGTGSRRSGRGPRRAPGACRRSAPPRCRAWALGRTSHQRSLGESITPQVDQWSTRARNDAQSPRSGGIPPAGRLLMTSRRWTGGPWTGRTRTGYWPRAPAGRAGDRESDRRP